MTYCHRVTYADCTVGNHVYYGRYLDILEAARGAFFRELGFPFTQLDALDVALPVVRVELDFQAPARYDDVLAVDVQLEDRSRVKLTFAYRVTREDGTAVLAGRTWHGITNHADKPRRLPAEVDQVLNRVWNKPVIP